MFTFLLWCVLLILCWPVALLALVLYPIVWLLLLPFRIVGTAFVSFWPQEHFGLLPHPTYAEMEKPK